MARAVAFEPFRRSQSGWSIGELEDDSFENLLKARLGPELARILGSALVHGIYAADSRQLSVKAAFPSLWDAVKRGNGSIVRGMLMSSAKAADAIANDYELGDVQNLMKGVSVYSFRDGMSTLTKAIETALEHSTNVDVIKNDGVVCINKTSSHEDIIVSSN